MATPASRRNSEALTADFFAQDVVRVARALIGAELMFRGAGGLIVETEAYHHEDPASHAFTGRTERNAAMWGPQGRAYVYRSYGIHWCLNVVAGRAPGSAVLIRALEPTAGIGKMQARRGTDNIRLLCAGPGRLCQALGITREDDGKPLDAPPFALMARARKAAIVTGVRIGLTKAVETPWRFGLAGSPFVSKRFPV